MTYAEDVSILELQSAAWHAFRSETQVLKLYEQGLATDDELAYAMEYTEVVTEKAIKGGVSIKDLPMA